MRKETIFEAAAAKDGLGTIKRFIEEEKGDVNLASMDCRMLICWAAQSGSFETFEYLLQKGATLITLRGSKNLLYFAAQNSDKRILQRLLDPKQKLWEQFQDGTTALHADTMAGRIQHAELPPVRSFAIFDHNHLSPLFYAHLTDQQPIIESLQRQNITLTEHENIELELIKKIKCFDKTCAESQEIYNKYQKDKDNAELKQIVRRDYLAQAELASEIANIYLSPLLATDEYTLFTNHVNAEKFYTKAYLLLSQIRIEKLSPDNNYEQISANNCAQLGETCSKIGVLIINNAKKRNDTVLQQRMAKQGFEYLERGITILYMTLKLNPHNTKVIEHLAEKYYPDIIAAGMTIAVVHEDTVDQVPNFETKLHAYHEAVTYLQKLSVLLYQLKELNLPIELRELGSWQQALMTISGTHSRILGHTGQAHIDKTQALCTQAGTPDRDAQLSGYTTGLDYFKKSVERLRQLEAEKITLNSKCKRRLVICYKNVVQTQDWIASYFYEKAATLSEPNEKLVLYQKSLTLLENSLEIIETIKKKITIPDPVLTNLRIYYKNIKIIKNKIEELQALIATKDSPDPEPVKKKKKKKKEKKSAKDTNIPEANNEISQLSQLLLAKKNTRSDLLQAAKNKLSALQGVEQFAKSSLCVQLQNDIQHFEKAHFPIALSTSDRMPADTSLNVLQERAQLLDYSINALKEFTQRLTHYQQLTHRWQECSAKQAALQLGFDTTKEQLSKIQKDAFSKLGETRSNIKLKEAIQQALARFTALQQKFKEFQQSYEARGLNFQEKAAQLDPILQSYELELQTLTTSLQASTHSCEDLRERVTKAIAASNKQLQQLEKSATKYNNKTNIATPTISNKNQGRKRIPPVKKEKKSEKPNYFSEPIATPPAASATPAQAAPIQSPLATQSSKGLIVANKGDIEAIAAAPLPKPTLFDNGGAAAPESPDANKHVNLRRPFSEHPFNILNAKPRDILLALLEHNVAIAILHTLPGDVAQNTKSDAIKNFLALSHHFFRHLLLMKKYVQLIEDRIEVQEMRNILAHHGWGVPFHLLQEVAVYVQQVFNCQMQEFKALQQEQQLIQLIRKYQLRVKDNNAYELALSQSELYKHFVTAFKEDAKEEKNEALDSVSLRYEYAEENIREFVSIAYHIIEPGFRRKEAVRPHLWSPPLLSVKEYLRLGQKNAASEDIAALTTLFRWCGELHFIIQAKLNPTNSEENILLLKFTNTCHELRNIAHHELNNPREEKLFVDACNQLHRYCCAIKLKPNDFEQTALVKCITTEALYASQTFSQNQ